MNTFFPKKKKDTLDAVLGIIELRQLVNKYLLPEAVEHSFTTLILRKSSKHTIFGIFIYSQKKQIFYFFFF